MSPSTNGEDMSTHLPFRRSRDTLRLPMAESAKENTRSSRPKASAKNEKGEYATFETALKKVLTVSHKEMQKRITRASVSRASTAKD